MYVVFFHMPASDAFASVLVSLYLWNLGKSGVLRLVGLGGNVQLICDWLFVGSVPLFINYNQPLGSPIFTNVL